MDENVAAGLVGAGDGRARSSVNVGNARFIFSKSPESIRARFKTVQAYILKMGFGPAADGSGAHSLFVDAVGLRVWKSLTNTFGGGALAAPRVIAQARPDGCAAARRSRPPLILRPLNGWKASWRGHRAGAGYLISQIGVS